MAHGGSEAVAWEGAWLRAPGEPARVRARAGGAPVGALPVPLGA